MGLRLGCSWRYLSGCRRHYGAEVQAPDVLVVDQELEHVLAGARDYHALEVGDDVRADVPPGREIRGNLYRTDREGDRLRNDRSAVDRVALDLKLVRPICFCPRNKYSHDQSGHERRRELRSRKRIDASPGDVQQPVRRSFCVVTEHPPVESHPGLLGLLSFRFGFNRRWFALGA